MIKLAMMFKDHMVLQRDKQVPIWGEAQPGATVAVTFQGQTFQAVADADGKWCVQAGPFAVSFGEDMQIAVCGPDGETTDTVNLTDVAVGDVWLAGGQSNMEFHMRYDRNMAEEKEGCANPNIRLFDYPEVSYVGQLDEADYMQHYGFWRLCAPEELERFTAVGYYFSKELQAEEQIPFGILNVNWGGSNSTCWMPREVVAANGGQLWLDNYDAAVADLDVEQYNAQFAASPMNYAVDQLNGNIGEMLLFGATMEEFMAAIAKEFEKMGIDPSTISPENFMKPMGPRHEWRPCGLYESMLLPVVPYGIKGVIWYQGCSDSDTEEHAKAYATLFPALIAHWRKLWNDEKLPFLFVQLAPLDSWMQSVGTFYPITRAAQQHTADTVPYTGMAVITDAGMQWDIHPKAKQPVGHRLALLAEHLVYGKDVLCEAPTLTGVSAEDGRVVLTFENAGDGLYLGTELPHGYVMAADVFSGVQVFQNGEEIPADQIKAAAEGSTVVLTSDAFRGGVPTDVKVACTGWYLVNLYNSAGIPARPAEVNA